MSVVKEVREHTTKLEELEKRTDELGKRLELLEAKIDKIVNDVVSL